MIKQTILAKYILPILFVSVVALFIPLPSLNSSNIDEASPNVQIPLKEQQPIVSERVIQMNEYKKDLYETLSKEHTISFYTIQANDTLAKISKNLGVTEKTLNDNNPNLKQFNISDLNGLILLVPSVDGYFYRWNYLDTWKTIALSNNLPLSVLMGWNPMSAGTKSTDMQNKYVFIPYSEKKIENAMPSYPYTNCTPTDRIVGNMRFIWPTDTHSISGDVFTLVPEIFHAGIDLGTILDSLVYAADDGNVVFSGWNDLYGNYIVIDHNNGWASLYGHLDKILITCGQPIIKGTTIALSGSTGKSSGPHLHFGLKYHNEWQNPLLFLP